VIPLLGWDGFAPFQTRKIRFFYLPEKVCVEREVLYSFIAGWMKFRGLLPDLI